MRILSRRGISAVAALGLAVSAAAVVGPASSGAATTTPPPASSSTPKEVLLDPTTGTVESVTQLSPAAYQALIAAADQASGDPISISGASPDISNHNICDSGNACYYTNDPPYADQGFYGSAGTYNGNWPYRNCCRSR